uniref:Uncharacterized protein n=1 Tax=Gadus morhua TaxID=8049 RepID=A0A8C5FU76_GADMO
RFCWSFLLHRVSTREGKYANLPCGLDSPVNLKDEVFDWKKEQQEEFFYKGKDYNNQGREGQDPQFVGRVRLLPGGLQASKASMILSSVTQADSGVHKACPRSLRFLLITPPPPSVPQG